MHLNGRSNGSSRSCGSNNCLATPVCGTAICKFMWQNLCMLLRANHIGLEPCLIDCPIVGTNYWPANIGLCSPLTPLRLLSEVARLSLLFYYKYFISRGQFLLFSILLFSRSLSVSFLLLSQLLALAERPKWKISRGER